MTPLRRHPRLRAALALAALALALWAAFLRPLPAHVARGVAYTCYAGGAPARTIVQGDHLQLLYHFDLFDAYLRGRLPWFRNLWEFNTSDEARPPRPDLCYFPFALPYSLARSAGASDALAWNLSQWLSVLLGLAFCRALARRCGAGPGTALAIAALATCVPYRWVVLAGGSPTGFGMGLVPGVALGVDLAVRDRRLRGGALAGALVLACYAADLHCFLFAVLALPLWGLVALLRSPESPFASRRRLLRLARALSPILLGGAVCGALGWAAKRAYASTDAAGGRTLRDLARHSPDWHAFFDPTYFSHSPEQLHQGWAIAILLSLAGLALLAAALVLAWRLLRRRRTAPFRSPAIVFDPRFSTRVEAPAPRDTAALRAALAGLLLGAAIVAAFFLALGTNGPGDALLLRAVRKLVPPFRMVRQPLKVLCLLPTLYTAFLALAWSSLSALAPLLRRAAAPLALSRLVSGQRERAAESAAEELRRAPRRGPFLRALPAAALVLAVLLSASRGMRAGVCLLPGPNAAYAAAVADAEARGLVPRALVLPIWPGDSSWSSIYEYHAMRAGLRMLNGYAAVTEPEYVERVFRRFETMTEGDFTADQAAALRKMSVTHVILHEDAFPAKVSPFPFGATLRRHLADPRLRLLAHDAGAWAFAVCDREGNAECRMQNAECTTTEQASSIQHSAFSIPHSVLEPPTRHWGVRPPQTNAATKVRSFAEIHREGYGWLVRAEAGKELALVSAAAGAAATNRFPAAGPAGAWRLAFLPALDPGTNLWTRLETPGEAAISYVAYARDPALGGLPSPGPDGALRLPAVDLYHEFGSTEPDPASPPGDPLAGARLAFAPGPHPPCTAVEGPCLPLALPAGRYRASLDAAPGAFRLDGADGVEDLALSPDGSFADFSYDGTSPVSFRVSYSAARPGVLSAILVSPAVP